MIDFSSLLASLEPLPVEARWDFFAALQLERRATVKCPQDANTWDAQCFSIRAFGVDATGASKREALAIWMECARRMAEDTADAPDRLAWALATIEGPDRITMEEAADAARIIRDHAGVLPEISRARAAAVLEVVEAERRRTRREAAA